MKEIITNYNVESTAEKFPETEFNKDTVYRRFGISRTAKDEGECWVAEKEIQYPKDLYLEMVSEENERLKRDNINNMKAMVELHVKILELEGKL